jgi:uncharacterized protein (DUF983 family)
MKNGTDRVSPSVLEFRETPLDKLGSSVSSHFGDEPPAPPFTLPLALKAVSRGLRKRCPACGENTMFRTFFKMEPVCSNCHVVYSREQGSYTGAMYLNILIPEALFVFGFVLMEFIIGSTATVEIAVLVPFNGLFPVWFFPRSRGLWAAVLYLCGDLYADPI